MLTFRMLLLFTFCSAPILTAELRLPHLFSDGMVLQRDRPVPIWGWAGAGESITVQVGTRSATAVADADGRWSTTVEPLAAGGPVEFQVTGPSGRISVRDVLVGDVFQISGQSNAAMSMGSARRFPGTDDDLAAGVSPEIRLFQVPWSQFSAEPRDDVDARWSKGGNDLKELSSWSALAFYFAREMHERLQVPIGIVRASHAGGMAEIKMSKEALKSYPAGKRFYDEGMAFYEKNRAKADATPSSTVREGELPPEPKATGKIDGRYPASDWNGAIAPVIRYAKRGVVWYQGEHNAGRGSFAYRDTLPVLVRSWREAAGDPALPFIIVQLPRFEGKGWPMLRESQAVAFRHIPDAALVVTIDLGEKDNIHPADKKPVALRAAAEARRLIYHQDVAGCGPLFAGADIRGDAVTIRFTNVRGGLHGVPAEDPAGFTIAGQDRIFVPAQVEIHGDMVVVAAPGVKAPVAVRYAWASFPEVGLFDGGLLPVAPFRTDTYAE